jgi:hypothetical protein
MLGAAATQAAAPSFTSADALRTLLTTESLVFAVFTSAVGLAAATPFGQRFLVSPRRLAFAAASFLTILAIGALVSWFDVFWGDWPGGATNFSVLCILVGIVAQPVFAWIVAASVKST